MEHFKNRSLVDIQFGSQHEASRMTGVNQASISSCCLGKLKTTGGF